MKREKRLEKGIESLKEQKGLHEQKKEQAKEQGNVEREGYYAKEIESIEKRIEDRKSKLNRK